LSSLKDAMTQIPWCRRSWCALRFGNQYTCDFELHGRPSWQVFQGFPPGKRWW